ncbi:acetyltransferase (GNAT) domain protein [Medicago truncatula]|uniref:Acetyltransferase (GNAT) domain protein n=1 Tax=Medicago truncatula TaxID=3880 RepID=A0A072VR02_MEDTR|nr:acetyltransferase (GNAT) domain protein [Medicago truncatula]
MKKWPSIALGKPYSNKEEGIGFIQNIASKSLRFRAICLRDRVIGCIDFWSCSDRCRNKFDELCYVICSMYWGKGIAKLIVIQVVEVAFNGKCGFSEGVEEGWFSKGGCSQKVFVH